MKVVAGSLGNDAIGPLKSVDERGTVRLVEWGPREAGLFHIDCHVLGVTRSAARRRRYVAGSVRWGHGRVL